MASVVYEDAGPRPVVDTPLSAAAGTAVSAVSWAAIFAGALAAAVLSLLLFMLGIGLGLSSMSVWSGRGADGETLGWSAIAWLAFTQIASAGVGGYLAGRLRTKWVGAHTDEVYFRDTAHGFLAWGFATLMMVVLMSSIVGGAVSGATRAAGAVASGAGQVVSGVASAAGGAAAAAAGTAAGAPDIQANPSAGQNGSGVASLDYWIDSLMRSSSPAQTPAMGTANSDTYQGASGRLTSSTDVRAAADDARTVATIFTHSIQTGNLSDADADYIASMVAQRSNVTQEEAKQKVQESFAAVQKQIEDVKQKAEEVEEQAKELAEEARKATAYSLLWGFVALLMGAFVASLCATFGGRQRDL